MSSSTDASSPLGIGTLAAYARARSRSIFHELGRAVDGMQTTGSSRATDAVPNTQFDRGRP